MQETGVFQQIFDALLFVLHHDFILLFDGTHSYHRLLALRKLFLLWRFVLHATDGRILGIIRPCIIITGVALLGMGDYYNIFLAF